MIADVRVVAARKSTVTLVVIGLDKFRDGII